MEDMDGDMKLMDKQKTNNELIEELDQLRKELDSLKAKIIRPDVTASLNPHPRSPRVELDTDIEFIADFDIVQAKGINVSESGICFQIDHDLPFELQFKLSGVVHRHRARLIWVKRLVESGYRVGLQFIPPEPYPQF